MDSTGEQLHPNWRALATVHLPLKRFIREGTEAAEKGIVSKSYKQKLQGSSGDEIKNFYEDITLKSNESKSKRKLRSTVLKQEKNSEKSVAPPQAVKLHFDREKYFRSAMNNKVEELEQFDYEGVDINVCDNYEWTALMMSACEGAEAAVEFLLKLGLDRNAKDKSGKTALDLATKKGHFNIVKLLQDECTSSAVVRKCADIKVKSKEPFFCTTCKRNFTETNWQEHQTSTVHQFNQKSTMPANKLQKFNISHKNRGLQLMMKQGWNQESGLGPSQGGRLYPVKTVIRKQRTGLGTEQPPARVTHFEAFDVRAVQRNYIGFNQKKKRSCNDIRSEKQREWKRERRLRNELS